MQLSLKFPDKRTVLSTAFLIVELAYLSILFALSHQTEVEMQKQLRANTIISRANTVSKLFYDAGIAMAGYSLTKSQLLNDRYQKVAEQIPLEVRDLRAVLGINEGEQQVVANLSELTDSGLAILNETKSEADSNRFDITQSNSREMYKEIRALADRLSSELSHLSEEQSKVEKKSAEASNHFHLALNMFFFSGFLLNIALAIALARCQRL